ncbi:Crp/Fnr family transcriptional regulator [Streptomyces ardesiacus]|uniref:Crp/Fnr family transcriptional regulator n=1 Tax=Streptomyces ardesiacus TaxID=285564 RepID=UPI000AAFD8C2|nr:Crp/Fnr family transcriptional regulator [Streptomyces sp. NBRC 110030]
MTKADPDRDDPNRTWCLSEVDIFRDLDDTEKAAIADMVAVRTYAPGDLLYTPREPCGRLFILRRGRVRLFRVSTDGRSLTCGILHPGAIFGEMLLFEQRPYGNYAEALDEVTVCVLSRADADRVLLSDARIAVRISANLGRRLADLEQRLSDSVFRSVSQRVAATLFTLAAEPASGQSPRPNVPYPEIALTHGQLAAIVGTARESVTKVLGGFAELGLVRVSRGHITVADPEGLRAAAGDAG